MSNTTLTLGQKVELNDLRTGTVRFVGNTAFQTGDWVGIELEESSGKNDGSGFRRPIVPESHPNSVQETSHHPSSVPWTAASPRDDETHGHYSEHQANTQELKRKKNFRRDQPRTTWGFQT